MTTKIAANKTSHYRHGEAFWRDLIARQRHSGLGVRKFCFANGVACSTFHKWRAVLAGREEIVVPAASVMTADAMFIPICSDRGTVMNSATSAPAHSPSPKSSARDSVILISGGVRVELTGAHADRIVRHLLGRLGATSC